MAKGKKETIKDKVDEFLGSEGMSDMAKPIKEANLGRDLENLARRYTQNNEEIVIYLRKRNEKENKKYGDGEYYAVVYAKKF